jgi:hypothetical protein
MATRSTPPKPRFRLKSPWWNNSVRRRWTRIVFVILVLFVALCSMGYLGQLHSGFGMPLSRLLGVGVGFLALPLLYPLARQCGASRTTALWAMAWLGCNVAWLWHLRQGDDYAMVASALVVGALGYRWLCLGQRRGILWLGIALVGALYQHPPLGYGMLFGLILHYLGWNRERLVGQRFLYALGIGLVGTLACALGEFLVGRLAGGAGMAHGQWAVTGADLGPRLLAVISLAQFWLLPLFALPLGWSALFSDPAQRWRIAPEGALPAVLLGCGLLAAAAAPRDPHVRAIIGLMPLAALWVALGFARLQTRTPAWVWLPVGVVLMLTLLPQGLVSWGLTRTLPPSAGVRRVLPDGGHLSPELVVPLYSYFTRELVGRNFSVFITNDSRPTPLDGKADR